MIFFFNLQIQRNQYACYLWDRSQCQICDCKDTCLQETENKELKLYQLKNALTDNSMKLKNVYMNLCIPDCWGYSLTSEILIHCDINSVWFKIKYLNKFQIVFFWSHGMHKDSKKNLCVVCHSFQTSFSRFLNIIWWFFLKTCCVAS